MLDKHALPPLPEQVTGRTVVRVVDAMAGRCFFLQDTVGDKALRVVDGAIFVAKSAPLGTAVKVSCDYCIETDAI